MPILQLGTVAFSRKHPGQKLIHVLPGTLARKFQPQAVSFNLSPIAPDLHLQNRFVSRVSDMLREALHQRPDLAVMYLPTAAWTRAPEGSGLVGRHPCVPADDAGAHFRTGTGNLAHIQQVRVS